MKRINADKNNGNGNDRRPFWMPWGLAGTAIRYILFLILLCLFILLLAWLHKEGHRSSRDNRDRHEFVWPTNPDDELRNLIDGDDPIVRDIPDRVKELPRPEDNRLIDVPEDEIITDPDDPYNQIISTRLNVILDSDADDSTFNRFAQEFKSLYPSDKYLINYYNPLTKMMQLTVPADERVGIKENLPRQITDINFKIFYEEIFGNGASGTDHNDPAFRNEKESWHFPPIQAYEAWNITEGSPDVIVAVIDSYIDVSHPELAGRIVKPYSVDRRSTNVLPPEGSFYSTDPAVDPTGATAPIYHGTHVAALAVGAIDNNSGAAGIAPKATLMPVSLGSQITSMKLLDGLLYAINQGADVVNLSIANVYPEEAQEIPLEQQVEYIMTTSKETEEIWDYVFDLADKRNCMIVWAAGNCNVVSGMDETKRGDNTLRVSSIDPDLTKSDFSNYGSYPDLGLNYSDVSAPGGFVYSATPGNEYGFCPGTSMAAPIVTGAVALMKSLNPTLTNAEIIKILKETGKPVKGDDHVGPIIQIADALKAVGGDFANFDEIENDPEKLIGTWKTTEERIVLVNGVETGDMCHIYLKFDTPERGTIIYRTDKGKDYRAPFRARIGDDRIYIDQSGEARSSNPGVIDSFIEEHFYFERGENGLLKCNRNGDIFYLVKSNL